VSDISSRVASPMTERQCCGHRITCPNQSPVVRARLVHWAEQRRQRRAAWRELQTAAHEVVMFWALSATASALDIDMERLNRALDALDSAGPQNA
jgi:hypothetical protein